MSKSKSKLIPICRATELFNPTLLNLTFAIAVLSLSFYFLEKMRPYWGYWGGWGEMASVIPSPDSIFGIILTILSVIILIVAIVVVLLILWIVSIWTISLVVGLALEGKYSFRRWRYRMRLKKG